MVPPLLLHSLTHSLSLSYCIYSTCRAHEYGSFWAALRGEPSSRTSTWIYLRSSKKKKIKRKKKIEKRSSENILLSACDCWLFDHYYCWCFTVSNVACFLWFSLFILEVVVVSHTHTPVQNSIRKKHNLSQKKKKRQSGRVFKHLFHIIGIYIYRSYILFNSADFKHSREYLV